MTFNLLEIPSFSGQTRVSVIPSLQKAELRLRKNGGINLAPYLSAKTVLLES